MPPSGSFHKKINFKLQPTVVTSSISVPDLLQAIIKSQQTTIELTNENHSNLTSKPTRKLYFEEGKRDEHTSVSLSRSSFFTRYF
jgi:hypothetical protein